MGQSIHELPLPADMARRVQNLLDMTGVPCEVQTVRPGHWRITHGNERVHLLMIYRRSGHSHKLSYHSELYVDGERRPNCKGIHSYVRLFKNPDNKRPNRKPADPLPALTPLAEGDTPPAVVTAVADAARRSAQKKEGAGVPPPRIGTTEEFGRGLEYAVEIEAEGGRGTAHLYFYPDGRWNGMLAVDRWGGDPLSEYKDARELLLDWFGIKMPTADAPPSPRTPRPDTAGAVSNAVMARRASVYRI